MLCSLCGSTDFAPSGFGSLLYEGRLYDYKECLSCRSSVCDPMPDGQTLARMYGPTYANASQVDATVEDPRAPEEVLARLRGRRPGVFVDFGCGSGSILAAARDLGWTAFGVEFDPEVVKRARARSGCVVLEGINELRISRAIPADAIHLGDVIEHLTAPLEVLRTLVGLLQPTGWLLAQGPLEAGPCLFASAVRAARTLRSAPPIEMPPYHVLQATVVGQRALFERVGLRELDYRVSEVAWPAPGKLTLNVIGHPRSLALFVLRRLSQAVSAVTPARLGNRYFYIGVSPHDAGGNKNPDPS